jgi:hypothetical protein
MNFKEITLTNFEGKEITYIEITNLDGSLTTFVKDPSNPVYAAWLATQDNG